MTSPHPTARGLAAALLALPLLTGCQSASSEGQLAILDEEPAGPIPETVNSYGILEPGSARHLGAVDGVDYYVAEQAATRGMVCLVPVRQDQPDESGGPSCSTMSKRIMVAQDNEGGEVALVSDETDPATLRQEGWTEVSQNLWAR